MDKIRISGAEERKLGALVGFISSLEYLEKLETRIRSIDGGWRLYRSALGMCEKLIKLILDTLPSDQLQRLGHLYKNSVSTVNLKPISQSKQFIHVGVDDIGVILSDIVQCKCSLCFNEGKDIDRCKTKKILDSLGYDLEEKNTICKYSIYKSEGLK